MTLAVVLVLLVVGSVVFHFASPWYLTEIASHWTMIDFTVDVTFWVTGIVFVAVNLFVAYAVIRFRHRKGVTAHYEPENKKLEGWLTVITSIGIAAMLAPGLFVWGQFINAPDDAIEVEAVGQQWHWAFRFPGDDGEFGRTDARLITPANPFGIDPDDAAGQDDVLIRSQTLHLPLDQPVKLWLRATDVLHNFTVPQFRVKMDLVPGMVTYKWLTPTRTGRFDLLCEQYCGIAHFAMRGRVVVQEAAEFEQWLDAQPTFAEIAARPAGDATRGTALYAVCAACHGQQGEGNLQMNSPKLAGLDAQYLKRQLQHYLSGARGAAPGDIYGAQMAPMARVLANEQAIDDVVAHILTLPDRPAEVSVLGDVRRGERLYTTCAQCHGARGEGIWSTHAPRLAGVNDWYLVRQLENFKSGLRGAHENDTYGEQMRLLAAMLVDEQSIRDVVAYINTLR
jgi:cytochrome c oxidase subunit II